MNHELTQMFSDFFKTMWFLVVALDKLLGLLFKPILIHFYLIEDSEEPPGICKIIGGVILFIVAIFFTLFLLLIAIIYFNFFSEKEDDEDETCLDGHTYYCSIEKQIDEIESELDLETDDDEYSRAKI